MLGHHRLKFFVLIIMLSLSLPAFAQKKTYHIRPDKQNTVKFTSDAPVEVINGTTYDIKGQITYDNAFRFDKQHPFQVSFSVDLNKIDTGIALRNEHMRDNFLESAKYPRAIFKVGTINSSASPPFKAGQVVTINSTGLFTVHGVSVSKAIPVQVTYHPAEKPGDVLRIQASFPVNLQAHKIQRPEVVFQKLAETIYVIVDAYAVAAP
ncbi:MAG: YceI family protein [Vampirovibrionales bacterium]|nr:YceI family protein [Vampirovibrionales bacterium]